MKKGIRIYRIKGLAGLRIRIRPIKGLIGFGRDADLELFPG
jgi:hypothetical protein